MAVNRGDDKTLSKTPHGIRPPFHPSTADEIQQEPCDEENQELDATEYHQVKGKALASDHLVEVLDAEGIIYQAEADEKERKQENIHQLYPEFALKSYRIVHNSSPKGM